MTNDPTSNAPRLNPRETIEQVARALPEQVRSNVIICGSLAAAYNFFSGDSAASLRTKDVDVLLSPHAVSVGAAVQVTEQLLAENWQQKTDAKYPPGGPDVPLKQLPVVRLEPPTGDAGAEKWFLELLAAPPTYTPGADVKTEQRVSTSAGDFNIPSFAYLALAEWQPIKTQHGVLIARPEMMALANMLHHPTIGPELMRDTPRKRSNKDLGRVLALAYLTLERDTRDKTDEFYQWAGHMWAALREKFGEDARELALGAGAGIDALLASRFDADDALWLANYGLLRGLDVDRDRFAATGRRLQAEVLEPLGELAAAD